MTDIPDDDSAGNGGKVVTVQLLARVLAAIREELRHEASKSRMLPAAVASSQAADVAHKVRENLLRGAYGEGARHD